MSLMKIAKVLMFVSAAAMLASCGFKPIYATPENRNAALNQQIALRNIQAPEAIKDMVTDELGGRLILKDGQRPRYDLDVLVRERAERLAVQIDATVTRYNYRLQAEYFLIDTNSGKRLNGRVEAVTSYNIVTSIYSTLFAERAAQEKAASLLAEEIERDLLLKFSGVYSRNRSEEDEEAESDADEDSGDFLFPYDDDPLLDGFGTEESDSFFRSDNAVPDPVVSDPVVSSPAESDPIVADPASSDGP